MCVPRQSVSFYRRFRSTKHVALGSYSELFLSVTVEIVGPFFPKPQANPFSHNSHCIQCHRMDRKKGGTNTLWQLHHFNGQKSNSPVPLSDEPRQTIKANEKSENGRVKYAIIQRMSSESIIYASI